jgi:hypothetical protein
MKEALERQAERSYLNSPNRSGTHRRTGLSGARLPRPLPMLLGASRARRSVRINQPHAAQVTPSWYGDSVGRYEGDTLVVDTVGIKVGPFTMVIFSVRRTRRLCTW